MNTTRERLLAATLQVLVERGITGVSARTIAAAAEVNQALVFYHFGSVDRLLDAAAREGAAERALSYRERFKHVTSLHDLLVVGRALHTQENDRGNVTVMAQVLAGARHDDRLVETGRAALGMWVAELEPVLARLLAESPLADVLEVPGLARAVAAAFVGLELYGGVDPASADAALAALERLAVLVDLLDDLGQVARAALSRRIRQVRPD